MIEEYVSGHIKTSISFTTMGHLNYFSALQFVDGVIGNSSGGLSEVPSFKIGTVNIGDRQKGRLKADSVIDCEPNRRSIKMAIDKLYSADFQKKLKVLENKTLRYIGHWEWMKAYRQLGLFNEDKISFNGQDIIPRDFYHHLLEPQLDTKDFNDICIMRVTATGLINGQKEEVVIDAYETYDDKTQLMAMEKWTGWHASIMMQHIANNNIGPGCFSIEKALTGHEFYKQALKRNYNITIEEV